MTQLTNTLIVWEMYPEEVRYFLVPDAIITDEHRQLMLQAQDKHINGMSDDGCDGLKFLNVALIEPKYADENTPKEWAGIYHQYLQDRSKPISANISCVVMTGFIL